MIEKKNLSKNELEDILAQVYAALCEKGFDASSQIAGYILSEDPIYMPDWNDARGTRKKSRHNSGKRYVGIQKAE